MGLSVGAGGCGKAERAESMGRVLRLPVLGGATAAEDEKSARFQPPQNADELRALLASHGVRATERDLITPESPRQLYFNTAILKVTDVQNNPVQYAWIPVRPLVKTTVVDPYYVVATLARNRTYADAITYEGRRALVSAADSENPLIVYHLFRCSDQIHSIVVRQGRRNLTLFPFRSDCGE